MEEKARWRAGIETQLKIISLRLGTLSTILVHVSRCTIDSYLE